MAQSDLNNIHAAKFTETVNLLSQQIPARVASLCTQQSAFGEKAQAVINLSPVDPTTLAAPSYAGGTYDGWYGDTEWDGITHTQRWALPAKYKTALPIHEGDLERMVADPRSRYAQAVVAGMNRKRDNIVMAAATGTVKEGPYSAMSDSTFPAANTIAVANNTSETVLSTDLLIDAKEILMANEGDMDGGMPYFVTNAKGIADLLKDDKLTSHDYNIVKALVAGEVDTFMGFKFVRVENIPNDGNTTPGQYLVNSNFAFFPSGLVEATWQDLKIRVDERPDKNYTWQIYATMTCGATRGDDSKFVVVESTPATAIV